MFSFSCIKNAAVERKIYIKLSEGYFIIKKWACLIRVFAILKLFGYILILTKEQQRKKNLRNYIFYGISQPLEIQFLIKLLNIMFEHKWRELWHLKKSVQLVGNEINSGLSLYIYICMYVFIESP